MRPSLVLVVVVGHLLAIMLAASPSVHQWLHGDADQADHQCAATALLSGQVDQPDLPAVFVTASALRQGADLSPAPTCPPRTFRGDSLQGRAPPVA